VYGLGADEPTCTPLATPLGGGELVLNIFNIRELHVGPQ
jgi:hypothetical protein